MILILWSSPWNVPKSGEKYDRNDEVFPAEGRKSREEWSLILSTVIIVEFNCIESWLLHLRLITSWERQWRCISPKLWTPRTTQTHSRIFGRRASGRAKHGAEYSTRSVQVSDGNNTRTDQPPVVWEERQGEGDHGGHHEYCVVHGKSYQQLAEGSA